MRSVPRKGLFFIELTTEEIVDLIDVRGALESLAITKCIDKIDEKGLKKLEGIIQRAEESLQQKDYKKCNDLDSLFHQKIAQATGNKKLIMYLQEIEDFMHIVRTLEKRTMAKQKVEK